ncbi:MAG: T9SS type A sorting domain-containing protein, partial [Balneolaceae bacterium]
SWPQLVNIPEGWTITLIDDDTNKRVDLLEENFYDFTLNERAKAPPTMNSTTNFRLVQKSMAKKQNARFTIEIDPGADGDGIPDEVELNQNFSNPFSQTTTIRFGIPREQRAKIEVYDVLGRLVQTITDQRYDADYHQIEFNGRSLASGVYIYRLITEEKTIVKKMTLIK